jgi:outer membrane receptor for ferrienterochelin and colicin
LPVTNPLTQLGSSQLPFGAIALVSVITGGFGAEFGRSIGGVMNITTKSGTNNWEAAPPTACHRMLCATPLDIYYDKTGNPDNASTDGKLYRKLSVSTFDEQQYGAYVSGPLIKDKLFMFLALIVSYQTMSA